MKYEETFKKHCVNLVVKEGQSKASVASEQRQSELEKEVKLLKKGK